MRLRADGVTWREIDGEIVILDLLSSTYLKTNQTGATLMRRLTEQCSTEELVDYLADAYDIPVERATDDVEAFVQMLRERNLLEPAG